MIIHHMQGVFFLQERRFYEGPKKLEVKAMPPFSGTGNEPAKSFKQARKARKKKISHKARLKALSCMKSRKDPKKHRIAHSTSLERKYSAVGPTPETVAKLTRDPLSSLKKNGSLSGRAFWAAQHIRQAYSLITDGAHLRVSGLREVIVQTSRNGPQRERDFEIIVRQNYGNWCDEMDRKRMPIGPVLDVVIEEISLSGVDRKWAKRKGWAKAHLLASLEVYNALLEPEYRNG